MGENLYREYDASDPDVPEDSVAWSKCRAQLKNHCPLVSFNCTQKDGSKVCFQTTVKASGGPMAAERIARLCWERFEHGASKDEVLKYRTQLYDQSSKSKAAGPSQQSIAAFFNGLDID